MQIARFQAQPGSFCQMVLEEEQITSLVPQELGMIIPFKFSFEVTEPGGVLVWNISYLYAELWTASEHGPVLIAPSLPEFTTDVSSPTSLRFPLTLHAVSIIEALRQGGDVKLVLHIQATLVGTARIDQVQDPVRRRALEALRLEQEFVGPIRRSQDVTIQIPKAEWEQNILPQWDPSQVMASSVPVASSSYLDVQALARTLIGASSEGDVDEIAKQFRDPIVGL